MRACKPMLLPLLALALTACGGGADGAGNNESGTESGTSITSDLVGKIEINGDTDPELRQFSFTDLDGVKQKCFLYGGTRGSVTCQPATPASVR